MSSPLSPTSVPVFTLHLCSYAQDVNGLLTMVNAGLAASLPGQPLYLAGFVEGAGFDLAKELLVVSVSSAEGTQELASVPSPPEDMVADTSGGVRLTLTLDLSAWSASAGPGEYEISVSFAGAKHVLPLRIESTPPAHAA